MNSADQVAAMIAEWKSEPIEKTDLMINIAEAEIGWPYAWGATGQRCTVANRDARMKNPKISEGDKNLIIKRCQVLNGSASSCAGCKYFPGGKCTEMRDCIAFVNELLTQAGIDHYGAGCTTMWNHAANWSDKGLLADMPEKPCLVFQRQSKQEPNRMQHVGYYIGGGYVIHCSGEVKKQKLSDYSWTNYAIPVGMGGDVPVTHKTIRRGDSGPDVVECQEDLIALGYDLNPYGADGKFGKKTEEAVKAFQNTHADPRTGDPLKVDGVVGKASWAALDKAIEELDPEPKPPETLYTVIIPHLTAKQAEELQIKYPDSEKRKEG